MKESLFDLGDDEEENLQEQDNNVKQINDTTTETNNNTIFNSSDISKESLSNKDEDFEDVFDPKDEFGKVIKKYIKVNKLCVVTYPEINEKSSFNISNQRKQKRIKPILKVQAALLEKAEGPKTKDFRFKYIPENSGKDDFYYYFFITKELNPDYMKPIIPGTNKKRRLGSRRETKDLDAKEENNIANKKINLNFDYNKFILKALLLQVNKKTMEVGVFYQKTINRETCQVSHTTKDSINYYKTSKNIRKDEEKNFSEFARLCPEKYFLIEIEQKKPASETIIKEDGILSVLYLITPEKEIIKNLFTMVKYSLYFSEETLWNYIGKYIRDMIYDYCHLPSECFEDFLSHIGCVNKNIGSKYNLIFPLKKYVREVNHLSKKCLISHVYRNLPNISRPKAADKIPFHKFIFLFEKYKLYYEEKEFKIKQKYFTENKHKKLAKRIDFLKHCFINDPVNDKITKEHKLDLNRLLKMYFQILEKFLKENFPNSESDMEKVENIKDFLIQSLAKFLSQYSAFKGFLNIDIVINEENRFEFQCSQNKACNEKINKKMFKCVVCLLRGINFAFHFNEGFFHQHFSIMDYSYNFNEKNVIHTFLCINDSSKKNRIRVFDIPFMDRWCYQIASLLLIIYRDSFGFLCNPKNKSGNEENISDIDYHENFSKLFAKIHSNIKNELFEYYKNVIPNYFEFCYKMSETPLDKYNCLDNLCQNFAIKSMNYLLKDNVIFFTPFEVVFQNEIDKRDLINSPLLNTIYEPYLILIDEKLKKLLEEKEKKEEYLKKEGMDARAFFKQLREINREKPHYTVFLADKKEKEIGKEDEDEEDQKENNEINTQINEEKPEEKNLEVTESISSYYSEVVKEDKPIDIKEVYPKKMHKVDIKEINLNIFTGNKHDYYFYYLLNLYYTFTYEAMKDLKQNFVDYDTLKRYIASIESSVTISFSDYDKTIMKQLKPSKDKDKDGKDCSDAKKVKKDVKKDIIRTLTIMSKLTRMTRHMNCIFVDYMKKVINDIIKGNFEIRSKIGDEKGIKKGKDYFMKIGHFMVNFKAYRADIDSFEKFKETEIYKHIKNDEHIPIENKDKMVIDK